MDTLSHALIGLAVAGLSGQQPSIHNPVYIAAILGAQAPDFDIIAQLKGNIAYLKQHRSFSHSLPGLVMWSFLITIGLSLYLPQTATPALFGWAFAGGLSHILIDYFNTHGVALLWPVKKDRKSYPLLNVFDPILLALMLSVSAYNLPIREMSLLLFSIITLYIGLRIFLRNQATFWIKEYFSSSTITRIWVMPSLKKIFSWDFVIETDQEHVVGEIGALYPILEIRAKLPQQVLSDITTKAQNTFLGKFFNTFTPFIYFKKNEEPENTHVHIYDLRYFLNEQFLHQATIVFDNDNLPCDSYVHSPRRKIRIPC